MLHPDTAFFKSADGTIKGTILSVKKYPVYCNIYDEKVVIQANFKNN